MTSAVSSIYLINTHNGLPKVTSALDSIMCREKGVSEIGDSDESRETPVLYTVFDNEI